jgi:two-component system NarL family sensor kinase
MSSAESELIVFIIVGTVLFLLVALFTVSFLFFYRQKQHRHSQEKNQMRNDFQRELLKTQLEIQEQTLKNISQEIHDNIGQTLSLAKLNLNTFDIEKREKAIEKVSSSNELVAKAINDLRNLSRSLNTDSILSDGLIKALETELKIIEHAGVFETDIKLTGQPIRIDPKKELILFRIVQEAVNNIIKHSDATTIFVDANFMDEQIVIKIRDNGKGFEINDSNEGSGLRNMNSRAQLIGGSFEVQSGRGGTILTVTLPINEV